MNPLLLKKFDFIVLFAYQLWYLKRLKEVNLKFLILLGFNIFIVKSNFFTPDITSRFFRLIIIPFFEVLSMLEILSEDYYQISELNY